MKPNNIIHKAIQHIDEAGVIGIILYGSYGLGKADNLSDLDIAVVKENGKEHFDYIESGDHDLDIAYIPKQIFEKVLEETHNRSNHSLWLTHSFYLRILATGKIIYDPCSVIKEYKKAIKQWKWTQQDIENAREHLRETIEYAVEEYLSNNILETTILLGDAINIYMIIKEMKNDRIPSLRPKDLYDITNKHGLLKQYITVHKLERVKKEAILEVIRLMNKEEEPNIRRNLKSIRRLLSRREKHKALLTVRKVFFGVIDQKMRIISNLYNPELKIRVLENINVEERLFLERMYNMI